MCSNIIIFYGLTLYPNQEFEIHEATSPFKENRTTSTSILSATSTSYLLRSWLASTKPARKTSRCVNFGINYVNFSRNNNIKNKS